MTDVMISYAREDSAFVRRLHEALKARNKQIWVDWDAILPSAEWLKEIYAGIVAADAVVFVISPDSVASPVCGQEIGHAIAHHKRLIPIVYRDVPAEQVDKVVAAHNWIFFRETDDFETALGSLLKALDTDLEWVKFHTRLLTRSIEWEASRRDGSLALQGSELRRAEQWLAKADVHKRPALTSLQIEYILASRRNANRRQRVALAASTISVFTAIILSLLLWHRQVSTQLYQSNVYYAKAVAALADHDSLTAEVLFAKSMTLNDQKETREGYLNAHVRAPDLVWIGPRQEGFTVLAISPDAHWFVQGDPGGSLRIWDAHKRREVLRFAGSSTARTPVAFSRSSRLVAVAHPDGMLAIYDRQTGRRVQSWPNGSHRVLSLAFSPDESRLAVGGTDRIISVWNIPSRKRMLRLIGHHEQVRCLTFSPDGKLLASGSLDAQVLLWDTTTGRLVHSLLAHEDQVTALAFNSQGTMLASGGWDAVVWLWDVRSGERVRSLVGGTQGILCLAFRADGQMLASGSTGGSVRLWDPDTGRNLLTLPPFHQGHMRDIAFSAGSNSTTLITGEEAGVVRIWNISRLYNKKEVRLLRDQRSVINTLLFHPDGKQVVSGGADHKIHFWDTHNGNPLVPMVGKQKEILSLAFSPDGRWLASGTGERTVYLWDVNTRKILRVFPFKDIVRAIRFTGDGKILAVVGNENSISFWDPHTGKSLGSIVGSGIILCFAFSPDGRRVAYGAESGMVEVWDIASHKLVGVLRNHTEAVWSVIYSPDGRRIASGGEDGVIWMWDPATMKAVMSLHGHEGAIWDMDFNQDGSELASGGSDAMVRLWNTQTGEILLTLRGADSALWCVRISPKEPILATGGTDRIVRLWYIPAVQRIFTAPAQELLTEAEQSAGLTVTADGVASVSAEHFVPAPAGPDPE